VLKLSANKTCLKDGKLAKKRMLKEVTPCAKQSEFSKTRLDLREIIEQQQCPRVGLSTTTPHVRLEM
jgi:hypothetical protein